MFVRFYSTQFFASLCIFPPFAFSAFRLSFILKNLAEVGQGFDVKDLVWPSFAEGLHLA